MKPLKIIFVSFLFACSVFSQIPRTISYQGILTDNGSPKPDGDYTIEFSLYEVNSGGQAIWNEIKTLTINNGLLSTYLGDTSPFGLNVKFDKPYWLGIKVGNEAELPQRIAITSAGYSFTALRADTALYSYGTVSSGPINITTDGNAVVGNSTNSRGIWGISKNFHAVIGEASAPQMNGVWGLNDNAQGSGVYGSSANGNGVFGAGGQHGVWGFTPQDYGIGVLGTSFYYGVKGSAAGTNGAIGVWGEATSNINDVRGVYGTSISPAGNGIVGENFATTGSGRGIWGLSHSPDGVGVFGNNTDPNGWAGYFTGKVAVKTLQINGGSDMAEPFDISSEELIEPGTVMSIDESNPGKLIESCIEYDNKVAGIVSGAGGIKPGITLHQDGILEGSTLIAISGRVYCKAEALSNSIEVGDLLTSSNIPGFAMKASDKNIEQGAVIGKAMTPLKAGKGLVLVLVNLQ
jgi:hypothetical protein